MNNPVPSNALFPRVCVTLVDGTKVVVPDSIDLMTPYVLAEQNDWFEDELKFLRHVLRPGERVIDIGANYGVFALCMARAVGASGRVWAFEPASATASMLASGIAANEFSQVVLERRALSNRSGTAELSLNNHSELNSLVRGDNPGSSVETVGLTTLDECLERYEWRDIAFVKIDAGGTAIAPEQPNRRVASASLAAAGLSAVNDLAYSGRLRQGATASRLPFIARPLPSSAMASGSQASTPGGSK